MEIINVTDEIIEINVTEAVVNIVTQTGAYPIPSDVFSVFGRVGNIVAQAGDYTTSLVTEGSNLYYTQARFNTAFGNKTTTDLAEGTNLYYTNARSRAAISETITGINYDSASGIFSMASGYVIPTQAMLDAKVPYTGATGDVTLGEHQIQAGQVAFDQTPTGTAGVGIMRWNDNDGTLDLGLKGGNVNLQIGQEIVARVVNKTGADLLEANYQVVRISSAQGQRVAVQLAQANNDANSTDTIGIVTETIQNNQEGFITILGQVKEINTTGSLQGETWADGDVLYLSPTTAGRITNIKPTAPQHMVAVGYVEYAHSQHGKIYTKIQNGYELEELHDVAATPYINNGVLYRDTTTNLWKSATIGTLLGYTPVTSARTISTTAPLTGGGDLTANRTFAITQSSASTDGYLSSTDWSTFNNKQPLITAGTTLQYYRGDKTFQTLDTTAVAEGTNLYYTDARARAAITGTAPISVSSGVVSISQAGGAANGFLSSTDWNTFNNKQDALNGTGFVKISGTTISYDNNSYLTTISGIAAGGELSGTYPNPTLVNSAVTGKILSGVNITGGSITDTDSILTAFGKLQNQVNSLVGGSIYKGTWNAATNTPNLTSGVGTKGWYYITDVYGTTNLDGVSEWHVGDWAIFDGVKWQKVDTTDAVISVNGQIGAVSLTTSNITEGSNLYFTNARAIGSTLTGYTSGAGVVAATDTILQAIQKLNGNVSGLVTGVSSVFGRTGAVVAASGDYNTSQVTEDTNLYYTQARFDTAFSGKTTTNLAEGTNFYYTQARFDTAFSGKSTTNLTEGTNLYYTQARFDTAFSAKSTTNLTEGTNLYFTNARSRSALSFAAGSGAYNSTTGVITIPTNTNQLTNGSSFITLGSLSAGTGIGYNNTTGVISSTITQYTDALARAAISLTTTGTSGAATYNSTTGVFNIPQYQSVLTNPVTGTGTTNTLTKFTSASVIGNSLLTDNGTTLSYNGNAVITSANIGSQSVSYATSAGNSSTTSQRDFNYLRVNSNNNLYLDYNYGQSIVGVYSASRFQGVFSMGDAYKLSIDGTSPGNLYGMAWSHPNAGGQAGFLNDHGLLVMVNGVTYAAISSNIWARGTITANGSAFANGNRLVENTGTWSIAITGNSGNTSSISNAVGNAYTWTGIQQFQTNNGGRSGNTSSASLQAYSTGNNAAFMSFHKGGHYAINMGLDDDNVFRIGGWSAAANRLQMDMSGNLTMAGSVTGSEIYSNGWLRTNGGGGLYFGAYGRGLADPESQYQNYGNVCTYGSGRNGWWGYAINDGSWNVNFMSNSGGYGLYGTRNGWGFWYDYGQNGVSIGGQSAVAGYSLSVPYDIYCRSITQYSDERAKKDITQVTNALSKLKRMRGVSYDFIDNGENNNKYTGLHLGVIAQEIQEIEPILVNYDKKQDKYSVEYQGFDAIFIEAIKEFHNEYSNTIIELQAQINDLKNQLNK